MSSINSKDKVLVQIYLLENIDDKITVKKIMKGLKIGENNLFKIIWKLEESNLIQRNYHNGIKLIKLTEQGKKLAEVCYMTIKLKKEMDID